MKRFIKKFLLTVNIVSFALVVIFGASGIIVDLFGIPFYMKILEKFKITWSFEFICLLAYTCTAFTAIIYFLRKKFFD